MNESRERVKVEYQFALDLYFRVRNSMASGLSCSYEFTDWVKSGVAYNVLGIDNTLRKISYFAGVYDKMLVNNELEKEDVQSALLCYYTDLFSIYVDYIKANLKQSITSKTPKPEDSNFSLIPSFKESPELKDIVGSTSINLWEYTGKYEKDMLVELQQFYLNRDSEMYKLMLVLYDASRQPVNEQTILEVTTVEQ